MVEPSSSLWARRPNTPAGVSMAKYNSTTGQLSEMYVDNTTEPLDRIGSRPGSSAMSTSIMRGSFGAMRHLKSSIEDVHKRILQPDVMSRYVPSICGDYDKAYLGIEDLPAPRVRSALGMNALSAKPDELRLQAAVKRGFRLRSNSTGLLPPTGKTSSPRNRTGKGLGSLGRSNSLCTTSEDADSLPSARLTKQTVEEDAATRRKTAALTKFITERKITATRVLDSRPLTNNAFTTFRSKLMKPEEDKEKAKEVIIDRGRYPLNPFPVPESPLTPQELHSVLVVCKRAITRPDDIVHDHVNRANAESTAQVIAGEDAETRQNIINLHRRMKVKKHDLLTHASRCRSGEKEETSPTVGTTAARRRRLQVRTVQMRRTMQGREAFSTAAVHPSSFASSTNNPGEDEEILRSHRAGLVKHCYNL